MHYTPKGVCSRGLDIEIENNKIKSVTFTGGCSGNTSGISRLVEGMDIDDVIHRLDGVRCGFKSTSCPDQLAKALKEYKENHLADQL